jgi:transposase
MKAETMPKKYVVRLTQAERVELESLTKSSKVSSKKARHAFILLRANEGEAGDAWKDARIAEAYGVTVLTVEKCRRRFVEEGMSAALARKPTSRVYRRKIEGEEEAHLIALACSEPSEGRSHWTMQLLADKMVELNYVESVSDETVRRVLKHNELKPWQKKSGASRRNKTQPLSARWKKS